LGAADVSVEASSNGALVHLSLDPPGGGNFLAQVKVDADLGARAFLSRARRPSWTDASRATCGRANSISPSSPASFRT